MPVTQECVVSSPSVDPILFFIHFKKARMMLPVEGLPTGYNRRSSRNWLRPPRSSNTWGVDTSVKQELIQAVEVRLVLKMRQTVRVEAI